MGNQISSGCSRSFRLGRAALQEVHPTEKMSQHVLPRLLLRPMSEEICSSARSRWDSEDLQAPAAPSANTQSFRRRILRRRRARGGANGCELTCVALIVWLTMRFESEGMVVVVSGPVGD
jgi:hypothetical protein